MRLLWLIVLLTTVLASRPVLADGIDLVPYLARTGGGHSVTGTVGLVILLMLVNYVLNFVVIGLPAIKVGLATIRSVSCGLILLTVLGQAADRLGAILAAFASMPLTPFFGEWVYVLLGLNFLFSGIAVWVLALYFLRRRWQVSVRRAWLIAGIAAILTNPAWAISLPFYGL